MYIHREYLKPQTIAAIVEYLKPQTIAAIVADLSGALTKGNVPEKQKIPVSQTITSLVDGCEEDFGVEAAMESMLLAGVDAKAIFAAREIEDEYRRRFGGDEE